MILNDIKLFCTDIDGVWTDGSMYYSEKGDELKKFHTYDSAGVLFLKEIGIETVVITSENTEMVKRRADKLGIKHIFQGVSNKLSLCSQLCKKNKLNLSNIAFIGDDLNDLSLLNKVGLSACPDNAPSYIKSIVDWVIPINGGSGAYRFFVEKYLKELGKLDYVIEKISNRNNPESQ